MNTKNFIQVVLLILIFGIIVISAKYYDTEEKEIVLEETDDTRPILEESGSNLIKDLEYFSSDNFGNVYKINSEFGEISSDDPDIIFMKKVSSVIWLVETEPINISSDYAKYNKRTYETNFSVNVNISHINHKIMSQNLDLSFAENLATISNQVVYSNLETKMMADRLEIDLISKNSKIYMNDTNKKIQIVGKN